MEVLSCWEPSRVEHQGVMDEGGSVLGTMPCDVVNRSIDVCGFKDRHQSPPVPTTP
jgi:hypothetical protein